MRRLMIALIVGLAGAAHARPADAQFTPGRDLRLSFNADGTVNLTARNVTAREILAEWGRQCGCHVVNAERLPGGAIMIPIQFEGASQRDVLASLLRSAAGYVLTPPQPGAASASQYGTIYILATSNPVAGPYVAPPSSVSTLPTAGSPADELAPIATIPAAGVTQAPGGDPAARPSNPFLRNSSPFGAAPASQGPAPGTVTAVPQAPGPAAPPAGQAPTPASPPRPGTVVPIVPIVPANP